MGQKLVNFVEARLAEEGCTKIIPDDEHLEDAYRRAVAISRINNEMKRVMATLDLDGIAVPDHLSQRIATVLHLKQSLAWDDAGALLAEGGEV